MPVKKTWKIRSPSSLASQLACDAGLTLLQAQLLVNRGISDPHKAHSFLFPRLTQMADPMSLKDMDDATATIIKALENREKITIYGDYDADGVTAAALLFNFFSSLRVPVSTYIPNRLKEGYGLNAKAVEKIAGKGTGLIITVDCGISNEKEIALAKRLGMNVVVTDHHQVPKDFHADWPVVNPNRPDCPFSFKDLAGVGISFFLAVAVRAGLRKKGWFGTRPEPDLKEYLDFVALGTVADRVPMLDQNRILVSSGMERMATSRWEGIRAIQQAANIDTSEITTNDLAFRIAPRLNAPGRMGDPEIGIELLTVEESLMARDFARKINATNILRQDVERGILNQIEDMISAQDRIERPRILFVVSEDWHNGVLGLVASRLVDRYHRPSLVLNIENSLAVGSGRSIGGFHLYKALGRLGHLFEKFGGHEYAAGFTLKAANIEVLKRDLEVLAGETLSDEHLVPTIDVDAEISLKDIDLEMVHQVRGLAPFGPGNPEPLFFTRSLEVLKSGVVGDQHLKLRLRQGENSFEAIGFGLWDSRPLEGKAIDIVFTPVLNRWQGYERIQLRIADLELVD